MNLSTGKADDDDPSFEGDALGGLAVRLSADGIKDHVSTTSCGCFLDDRDKVVGRAINHDVGAESDSSSPLCLTADNGDYVGTSSFTEFDGG